MAKPGGRLQAETGRMLRAALLVFAVAWIALLLLPAENGDWEVAFLFFLPGTLVNVAAMVLLMRAYTRAWGVEPEDVRTTGATKRNLVRGTWALMLALVLYVAGIAVWSLPLDLY